MGGLFGVVSKKECLEELLYGTIYHSHLGDGRAGLSVFKEGRMDKKIRDVTSKPVKVAFSDIYNEYGNDNIQMGIGKVSSVNPQPLTFDTRQGQRAVSFTGMIRNCDEIAEKLIKKGHSFELSDGKVNPVSVVNTVINEEENVVAGIESLTDIGKGSINVLMLTNEGIIASRDALGRTPLTISKTDTKTVIATETSAFHNIDCYHPDEPLYSMGPGEIVHIHRDGEIEQLKKPNDIMQVCGFYFIYTGFPASEIDGISIENYRYGLGANVEEIETLMNLGIDVDFVADTPDSGSASAYGAANYSKLDFKRVFNKYQKEYGGRSFTPGDQRIRYLIAKLKLIPVPHNIRNQKFKIYDDSIVRGTQFTRKIELLEYYKAIESHVRISCHPYTFACKYLNSTREPENLAWRKAAMQVYNKNDDDIMYEIIND
ncbi:amidophosphoribosyltransferase, partial [Nanoarchaeota archaeon]